MCVCLSLLSLALSYAVFLTAYRLSTTVPTSLLLLLLLLVVCVCVCLPQKKASSLSCLRVPPKLTRYCTICCKNSPGLDHHCTWLNTCIGENNYEAFYCLVVSATTQTLGQAVIGILMATLWFDDVKLALRAEWHEPMLALLWVHNAVCLSLANSYFLLAGFHTYLLCIGSGTYDFILANGSDGLCARLLKCKCLRRSKATKTKKTTKLSHVVSDDRSAVKQQQQQSAAASLPDGPPSTRRSKSPVQMLSASASALLPSSAASAAVVSADDAMQRAAAKAAADKKQQDMAQWKAEWVLKYGADDDDDDQDDSSSTSSHGNAGAGTDIGKRARDDAASGVPSSTVSVSAPSATTSASVAPLSTPVVAAADASSAGLPPPALLAGAKVSARRTSTYPAELVSSPSASGNSTNTNSSTGNSSNRGVGETQVSMSVRQINRSEGIFEDVELVDGAVAHREHTRNGHDNEDGDDHYSLDRTTSVGPTTDL